MEESQTLPPVKVVDRTTGAATSSAASTQSQLAILGAKKTHQGTSSGPVQKKSRIDWQSRVGSRSSERQRKKTKDLQKS